MPYRRVALGPLDVTLDRGPLHGPPQASGHLSRMTGSDFWFVLAISSHTLDFQPCPQRLVTPGSSSEVRRGPWSGLWATLDLRTSSGPGQKLQMPIRSHWVTSGRYSEVLGGLGAGEASGLSYILLHRDPGGNFILQLPREEAG